MYTELFVHSVGPTQAKQKIQGNQSEDSPLPLPTLLISHLHQFLPLTVWIAGQAMEKSALDPILQ